jgi:hypothetical protein
VDYFEFYLLNYFKPATYEETPATIRGRRVFERIDCVRCHVPVDRDRRVADVDTQFDSERGGFNGLFATAKPLVETRDDHTRLPVLKTPKYGSFVVKNIFTDFKRHDLGANFPRTKLPWDDTNNVSDSGAVGRGHNRAVWTRWPEH